MALQILRLNSAGSPIEWIHWQEAASLYAKGRVSWTLGETIMQLRGGFSRTHNRRSILDIHGIIACNGRITEPRKVPPLTNRALFRRDQHVCMYCAHEFNETELTRDHIVPKSKGGRDRWTNVVTACKRCNQAKGDRLLEDSGMQLVALPYQPNLAEYLALINSKRILASQMEFLKSQFGKDSRLA